VGANSNLGDAANELTFNGGILQTSTGLTISRAVVLNGGGGSINTNGFDSTFSGIFSGTGGLTKLGAGTLTLSGNNTYDGSTVINAGILSIGANSNLGDAANGLAFDGGTLLTTAGINSARTVTRNGGGGTVDTNGFDSTFSGVVTGTGKLTKIGTGTLTLSNTNNYSGGTTLSAGVLQGTTSSLQGNILNNASLIFNQTGNGTYSGVISGTGSLTKQNTGTVILSGTNDYSGGTTVSAGVLQGTTFSLQRNIINNASLIFDQTAKGTYSDVIRGTGSVTKQNIGTVTFSGNNTYNGNTNIDGGTLVIGSGNNLGDAANSLVFGGGTLQVTTGLTISRAVTLNAGGGTIDTNSFDSTFSGLFSGSGELTKIGAGTLTLTGTNDYTGNTNIDAGILNVAIGDNLGDAANGLTFDGGTLFTTGAITTSRAITLNAGGGTIDTSGFDDTFSGVIDGGGSLTKNSAGTLTLSGASTYSGGTVINGGTISIGNNNNLGAASSLTLDSGTLFTTAGITSTRPVALKAGGGTFDTNGFNSTFSGVFSDTGALSKNGAGTLTLSGTNTYSGDTLINVGTLQLGATNSLPFGTNVQISTGAIFDLNSNDATIFDLSGTGNVQLGTASLTAGKTNNTTFLGMISGTGSFTKNGTGILTLLGTNSYSGGTSVAAGVLKGNTASLQGNIVANNSVINFDQTLNGTFSGVISGNGAVTKTGTGTTTFTGMNIYSGATTINAGRLTINGAITSETTVNSGGTLAGNGTITGNVTVNSGGTVAGGSSIGTLSITGNYTQAVGSFLEVEIQPAANPTNPGVDNDLVDVTENVTLNGGTVNVKGANGTYTPGAEYVFLQHSGTRTGTFAGITDDLAFMDASLLYSAGNVAIVLQGAVIPVTFASQAATSNQLAVGAYLDSINTNATGDLKTVLDEMMLLTQRDVRHAYDLLSADFQGSLTQIGLLNTSNMYSQLSTRLRPGLFGDLDSLLSTTRPESYVSPRLPASATDENGRPVVRAQNDYFEPSQEWSGWAFGYGLAGRVTSDQRLNHKTNGTMFGLERFLDPGTLVGMYGNYSRANITTNSLRRAAHIDNYTGGAYLRQDDGVHYTLLSGAIGYDRYDTSRGMQFAAINREARVDYEGYQYSLYLERGMTIDMDLISLQPYLALQYIHHQQHRFTEFGAGALDLSVGATSANSLRTMLGGRLAWEASTRADSMTLLPELRVAWAHEYLDTSTTCHRTLNNRG
jgi:autotransporter-associated beta strand protein